MRWSLASRVLLLALGGAAGCGDDAAPCGAVCATPDGGAADGGAALAAPVIDWLDDGAPPIAAPSLAPCPTGWHEQSAEEAPPTCDPYGEPAAACPGVDQARFPGEASCRRLGPACPAGGGLPADVPADRPAVYVLAGAAPGGDGTRAAPHDELADLSFGSLARDTVVALGTGRYDAEIAPRAGVALVGACAGETVLTSSTPSEGAGVVTVAGAGVEIRALRIADAERPAVIVAGAGRSIDLDSVVIEGARTAGLIVRDGAAVVAHDLAVRGTRGRASDLDFGRGISLDGGAQARLTRASFEGNREIAIYAGEAGTRLELSDSVVRGTLPSAASSHFGRGIDVESGAVAELRRVLVAESHDVGIFGLEAGTGLVLEDVVVRDTLSDELARTSGRGVNVQRGVTLQASRLLVERSREVGLFANDASEVTLADVVVRDIAAQERDGVLGRGVEAQRGATMEIARARIERTFTSGLHMSGAGTVLRMQDGVVRDTQCEPASGGLGRGLNVQLGAVAEVTSALFEQTSESAVFVNDPDSRLLLSDAAVRDTRPNVVAADFGRGVDASGGATARLSRVVVDRNRDVGVFVGRGAMVDFEDLVVRDTLSRELDGTAGHALFAQFGARAGGIRARLERNHDAAVVAIADARVDLSDLHVSDTAPRACAADTCAGAPAGSNLVSVLEAALSVDRFVLTRAALCGVQLARGGAADLSRGEISESEIGACIQVDGYDTSRLTNEVVYRDNGTNLQATDLPVPDTLDTLSPGD